MTLSRMRFLSRFCRSDAVCGLEQYKWNHANCTEHLELMMILSRRAMVMPSLRYFPYRKSHMAITKRADSYSLWYSDVINAADMIDQGAVRGCIIMKPMAMDIWDIIRSSFDSNIKDRGVKNVYFPMLIPMTFLSKEAAHVDGFAKECAVVTHHRLVVNADKCGVGEPSLIPDPNAVLEEPLVLRPTSETAIWSSFHKWINSYRDLPLKINQWANVVRWEKRPRPFLRNSEFLWQEGHTAHASAEEALRTAQEMLDVYADMCRDLLAIPMIRGVKSPTERFAGAVDTFTIEGCMQSGWALQCGTSHFLGTNFAEAFDVLYQTPEGDRKHVWATSWGISTRLIGALVMTHSDDVGLVLPPSVAPTQVVLVPIAFSGATTASAKSATGGAEIVDKLRSLAQALRRRGVRCHVDCRKDVRPGAKYFEWERKGVPLRLVVGPKDMAQGTVTVVERVAGEKQTISFTSEEEVAAHVEESLASVQSALYAQAESRLEARMHRVHSYDEMCAQLKDSDGGGFFLVPWKDCAHNELKIKEACKMTLRCFPYDHNKEPPSPGVTCFFSNQQATHMALFARAY